MLPDPDLLRRHDRPGPRYTSYPTAPVWSSEVDGALLEDGLRALDPHAPVAVYVHVPFCREQCLYCGCHMAVSGLQRSGDRYLDALEAQVSALPLPAATMPTIRTHLGGGTPTWLSPAQLRRLYDILDRRFVPAPGAGRSVEADPAVTTEAHLDVLAEAGVERLSFGVQSLDPVVLDAVQRPQDPGRIASLIRGARARGITSVNLDLMYGLPKQTLPRWDATLRSVIGLSPDRLAVFGYAHVPWMKAHQRRLDAAALPGAEDRLSLLLHAHRVLREAGYEAVGFDHFARRDDPLAVAARQGTLHRDFMGYTARPPAPMIGLGPSAISQLPDRFAQQEPRLGAWWKAVEAGRLPVVKGMVLSDDDRLRQAAIHALTTAGVLDLDALGEAHHTDARATFADALAALAPLVEDGIVAVDDGVVRVPERGRLLVRNVAMAFDAYLGDRGARFSRVV